MPRPSKYTPARVARIVEARANGDTVEVACIKGNISETRYYEWLNTKQEFREAIKKAEAEYERWERMDMLKEAKKSLKELVKGPTREDADTILESDPHNPNAPRIKRKTVHTTKMPPNVAAVIFALTNCDPEHWKNKQDTDVNLDVNNEEPPVIIFKTPAEEAGNNGEQ